MKPKPLLRALVVFWGVLLQMIHSLNRPHKYKTLPSLGGVFHRLFSSMILFQKSEQELEYLFFESCEKRIFHDEHRIGIIVDNRYLVFVDELADIVLEEIEVLRDSDDIALEPWTFGLGERF